MDGEKIEINICLQEEEREQEQDNDDEEEDDYDSRTCKARGTKIQISKTLN